MVGTPGEDLLVGSKYAADVIVARGGDDIVRGRGGSDVICVSNRVEAAQLIDAKRAEQERMRQQVARHIHHLNCDIVVRHANVDVHAEDQQLERKLLHLLDHPLVAVEWGNLLAHP